ncbi:hypothetical protein [Rhizobium sp. Root1220]|uniref:hypothetical protein n=1 Tax=Rhizobium sp. Root1220 TaxID=1736432 RepID=UPI0006F96164|nr:hypothetical protein [Rhizobium sp. Root1220]KQV66361.1 hypothetical protein ASC90_14385 [Rhizobium sp. Root1220]
MKTAKTASQVQEQRDHRRPLAGEASVMSREKHSSGGAFAQSPNAVSNPHDDENCIDATAAIPPVHMWERFRPNSEIQALMPCNCDASDLEPKAVIAVKTVHQAR